MFKKNETMVTLQEQFVGKATAIRDTQVAELQRIQEEASKLEKARSAATQEKEAADVFIENVANLFKLKNK